jgi:hypothetical protein
MSGAMSESRSLRAGLGDWPLASDCTRTALQSFCAHAQKTQ